MRQNSLIYFCALFLFGQGLQGCGGAKSAAARASSGAAYVFPQSWFGTWKGKLEIYSAQGLKEKVDMQLVIGPADSAGVYRWNIIYGADTVKGARPYLLRTIDSKNGRYLTDELNGIRMESYFLGGRLLTSYAVEGNLITSVEEKIGDHIQFDILFGKDAPTSVTGGGKYEGEDIAPVKAFPVRGVQRAVLYKK